MLRSHAFLTVALYILSSCRPLSTNESKVVGTWQWTTIDAIGRVTFMRNHRMTECLLRGERYEGDCDPNDIEHGKWWIQGDKVVYKIDNDPSPEAALPLEWFLEGGALPPKGPNFKRLK